MDINRDNYEAFLLDHLEGRLPAEAAQQLREFLVLNPDCAMPPEGAGSWILEKNQVTFPGKAQLRKEFPDVNAKLDNANFDLFSIARMEGDLTESQVRDHAAMVAQDPMKSQEWAEWQRTRLIARPVVFMGKRKLMRRKGITSRVIWLTALSAAAVITLLLILMKSGPVNPEPQLAQEVETTSPRGEDPLRMADTEDPPLNKVEDVVPVEKVVVPVAKDIAPVEHKVEHHDKPGLFSIKKNPGEPEPSGSGADSINSIRRETVQPRTLRIAGYNSGSAASVEPGSYDQIMPLDIGSSSIHLSSLSLNQIAEMDLQEIVEDYTQQNEISFWTIANAGIRGINRITGADMALLAARDEEGDLSGFRFKGKRFSVTTPLAQSE